jgi:hypothetical protein
MVFSISRYGKSVLLGAIAELEIKVKTPRLSDSKRFYEGELNAMKKVLSLSRVTDKKSTIRVRRKKSNNKFDFNL